MAIRPVYFTERKGSLAAVIPMMEVSSFLTGKRAVSLPFTDYCEPLVPHVEVSKVLFEAIVQEGRKRQWKYIELRGGTDFLGDGPASAWFYRHTLDLTPGDAKLFKGLRDSTRRNIKKAEKEGVEMRFETTAEALREFYRLNCLTRREHGLPPQPWQFFEHLHEEILAKGMGSVALADYKGNTIAANVYLHANGEAIYKYGASDKAHQNLRANNVAHVGGHQAVRRQGIQEPLLRPQRSPKTRACASSRPAGAPTRRSSTTTATTWQPMPSCPESRPCPTGPTRYFPGCPSRP